MAQIDTSAIQGFDTMTAEEKVTALLGFNYDDGADALKAEKENSAKIKAAFDKASSEIASYKKQLNATKSEEEQAKIANEEMIKALQDKVAEFELQKKISDAKSVFLGGGFDDANADDAANAFIEGDIEKLSTALKKYREAIEVSTKSKLMGSNPKPEAGGKADDGKAAELTIAEQLGKARAEQTKRAQSIINQYT